MKFFIPDVADPDEAEKIYQSIRQFARTTMGWKIEDARIYSVSYTHDGRSYTAAVGERAPRIHETVVAILASNSYLVCTPNRGVLRDMPLLVGQPFVVTEFDP